MSQVPTESRARVRAETVYLIVAAVAGTTAVVLWLLDVAGRGVFAILVGIFAASFVGYLVRSAQAELIRRGGRKAAAYAQQLREIAEDVDGEPEFIASARTEGYAEGYVAGVRDRLSRKGPDNQSN